MKRTVAVLSIVVAGLLGGTVTAQASPAAHAPLAAQAKALKGCTNC